MERPRIPFAPCWEGAIAGYAVKAIRASFSGLNQYYEFEDLLQDAYVVFLTCAQRYVAKAESGNAPVVNNPRWFMALFKVSLRNKLCDRFNEARRYSYSEEGPSEEDMMEYGWAVTNLGAKLSDDLAFALRDIVRPNPRLHVSSRTREELRRRLTQEVV